MSIDELTLKAEQELQRTDTRSSGEENVQIIFNLKYEEYNPETGEKTDIVIPYDPTQAQIHYVRKYCEQDHVNDSRFLLELMDEKIDSLVQGNVTLTALEEAGVAEKVCNPYISHQWFEASDLTIPEKYSKTPKMIETFAYWINRASDCAPYHIGVAMMEDFEKIKEAVIDKIEEQGLTGTIEVNLMSDFNLSDHGLRSMAEYPGNSTDFYCIRRSGENITTHFKEFQDSHEADVFRYAFFHDK